MAMSCRRGNARQKISDDGDGVVGIRATTMSCIDGRASINCHDVHSSLYEKPVNISSRDGILHSELRFYQRHRQSSHILPICTLTLMAVMTCADAIHHAAFVGRIGRSHWHKSSITNQDHLWLSPHPESLFWNSGVSNKSTKVKSIHQLPSLWLSQSSDTEVQTDAAQSKVDDEEEWRTVLAAFKMYKAAYGDLKVPSRFIVPGMAPWPGELYIVKLQPTC